MWNVALTASFPVVQHDHVLRFGEEQPAFDQLSGCHRQRRKHGENHGTESLQAEHGSQQQAGSQKGQDMCVGAQLRRVLAGKFWTPTNLRAARFVGVQNLSVPELDSPCTPRSTKGASAEA